MLPAPAAPALPPGQLEKYSAAATLSDMEIFVFPELLFSLVLANILSPRLWAWRDDPWFKDIEKLKPYRRVLRLKQFIIDRYEFNLDLDTWGVTTKEQELARFAPFIDEATISRSNALFGYEGDQYYFALDIRRHFGLDKYTSNVIPYWKTETLEAMDAFRRKPGYTRGAGECVSLSTLYAAALFVVCRVPLEEIFLLATPLHSQNYVSLGEGVLTNNRRIVTKNMWFNGTEQTAKAQRALRHEQITIVSHATGHIHCVYPEATIDPAAYRRFQDHLRGFLRTEITMEILANFLRDSSTLQKCFQIRHEFHGRPHYIAAEKVYAYEHASSFKVSDATREKLLAEIDEDEYFAEPLPGRMLLNKFDDFFKGGGVDIDQPADLARLAAALDCQCNRASEVIEKLVAFARHEPRFPDQSTPKQFRPTAPVGLTPDLDRDQVLAHLEARRAQPEVDLAFYACRDLARTDWAPFLKGALERSPVSRAGTKEMADAQVIAHLQTFESTSIYDGTRAAQPDEVWNFRTGDGLEQALCAANILCPRHPDAPAALVLDGASTTLELGAERWTWPGSKGLTGRHVLA
jgi:hypothetical protein